MSEVVIDALTNGLAHLPIRGAALRFAAMQQIAALSAAGYVIVPKEPTDAMIEAGVNRLAEEGIVVVDRDPLFVWRAMLHEAEKP